MFVVRLAFCPVETCGKDSISFTSFDLSVVAEPTCRYFESLQGADVAHKVGPLGFMVDLI